MMKRLIFSATIFVVSAFGQGWHQLTNTTIAVGSGTSICPPDHLNNGLVTGFGTWPDILYYSGGSAGYGFRGCTNHYDQAYNGGVVDTKRSRLLIQGGGHNGQPNNAFMSLDLATISQTTATCGGTGTCNVTSNQGGSPKTPATIVPGTVLTGGAGSWTRLNDPSFPPGCGAAIGVDNTSVSLQSYQGLVYLPKHDMVFYKGAANCGASSAIPYSWFVDMSKLGVPSAGNPWILATNGSFSDNSSGYFCDNYPNSINPSSSDFAPNDEKIVCMAAQNLFIVDADQALASIYPFHLLTSLSIPAYGGASILRVDPKRRNVLVAGTSIYPNAGTGIYMFQIGLDPPYTTTTLLAKDDGNNPLTTGYVELAKGCDTFAGYSGSGMAYDPTINRFVTYAPRTVLSTSVSSYSGGATNITVTNLTGAAPVAGQVIFATNISNPSGGNTTISSVVSLGGGSYSFNISNAAGGGASHALIMLVSSTASNQISIFDPATMTCTTQPMLGGSGPSSAELNAVDGTWGRFGYVPNLNEYVLWNNAFANAYTFKLNTDAPKGLGSSTLTCVDRDGDGYGTGPGCTGPDADDLDANVHTEAQLASKWGSLQLGLNHLGYNPPNIWYISTAGTDAGSPANCKNTIASPCATAGYVYSNGYSAGDAILYRGGTYNNYIVQPPGGTSGNPVINMGYPGELPLFTTPGGGSAAGFDLTESQFFNVIDGITISNSGAANACIHAAENNNVVMRHVDTDSCGVWGIDFQGDLAGGVGCTVTGGCRPLNDITVEDSIAYNMGGQHGLYFSSHSFAQSQNIFWRRIIVHNNPWNGFHLTGPFSNVVLEQSLTYSNGLAGVSWQSGTSNSILQNWVSINDFEGLDIDVYNGDGSICDSPPVPYGYVCPGPQNNNLFTNNTVYLTGFDVTGAVNQGTSAGLIARQSGCTSVACSTATQSGNIFQNFLAQVNNASGGTTSGYGAFHFPDTTGTTYLNHTSFINSDAWDIANPGPNSNIGDYGFGFSFGYAPKNCTQWSSLAASNVNCMNAMPLFVSTCTYNTISSCNLNLQASSPVLGAGTPPINYSYDLIGTPLSFTAPAIGALQPTSAPCVILPSSLGPWTVNQPINQTFTAPSCSSSTWSSTGTFPPGLSFNTITGVLSGTITSNTGTPFTPSVTYSTATNNYSIPVNAVPSVTTCGGSAAPNCPGGRVGSPYLTSGSAPVVLATINGTGTVTCAVTSGSLPAGLSISGCTITGTPSLAGTFNFNVTPTDVNAVSGSPVAYSILISTTFGTPQPSIIGVGTLGTGIKH